MKYLINKKGLIVLLVMFAVLIISPRYSCAAEAVKTGDNATEMINSNNVLAVEENESLYREVLDAYYEKNLEGWKFGTNDDEWNKHGDASEFLFYLEETNSLGYTFVDLDNNGISELLISSSSHSQDGIIFDMYTYKNGNIKQVFTSWFRDCYYLSVNNSIRNVGSGSALESSTSQYSFEDDLLKLIQEVRYDGYANKSNPWFYIAGEGVKPVSISKDKATAYMEQFPAVGYEIKLFKDYKKGSIKADGDDEEDGLNLVKTGINKVKSVKVVSDKKKLTVKWKKHSDCTGYQLQVSKKKNYSKVTAFNIKKTKKQYVIKNLQSGKKYYIRIRAYKKYKDMMIYSKWVKVSRKTK